MNDTQVASGPILGFVHSSEQRRTQVMPEQTPTKQPEQPTTRCQPNQFRQQFRSPLTPSAEQTQMRQFTQFNVKFGPISLFYETRSFSIILD